MFPDGSAAVSITFTGEPTSVHVNEVCDSVKPATPQLSADEMCTSEVDRTTLPELSSVFVIAVSAESVGGALSVTVTVVVSVTELPDASVTTTPIALAPTSEHVSVFLVNAVDATAQLSLDDACTSLVTMDALPLASSTTVNGALATAEGAT